MRLTAHVFTYSGCGHVVRGKNGELARNHYEARRARGRHVLCPQCETLQPPRQRKPSRQGGRPTVLRLAKAETFVLCMYSRAALDWLAKATHRSRSQVVRDLLRTERKRHGDTPGEVAAAKPGRGV